MNVRQCVLVLKFQTSLEKIGKTLRTGTFLEKVFQFYDFQ